MENCKKKKRKKKKGEQQLMKDISGSARPWKHLSATKTTTQFTEKILWIRA